MKINQPALVTAITKHIAKTAPNSTLNQHRLNVIITAANQICEAFERKPIPAVPRMGLEAWWACDDVGMSSLYMAWLLSGKSPTNCPIQYPIVYAVPRDLGDFGRCYKLLRAAPELNTTEGWERLKGVSKAWERLAKHWADLEKLYEAAKGEPEDISTSLFQTALDAVTVENEALGA